MFNEIYIISRRKKFSFYIKFFIPTHATFFHHPHHNDDGFLKQQTRENLIFSLIVCDYRKFLRYLTPPHHEIQFIIE